MKCNGRNIPSLTRRELLRVGGVSLVGGYLNAFRPFNVRAEQKVQPMGTARQVLFINIDGGMSQIDTLDAKEGPWTPSYFNIRSFPNDLKLPTGIMPNLPGVLDKITVVRGDVRDFATSHPAAPVLVVEVSLSSLAFDREHKGSLYARAGRPEYWIVNLVDRVLEVRRQPAPEPTAPYGWDYAFVDVLGPSEHAGVLGAPAIQIPVADLLP